MRYLPILCFVGCEASLPTPEATSTSILVEYRSEPIQPLEPPDPLPPERVELGGLLFHDTRLSIDDTISCASCHSIPDGGDDGLPTSLGVGGQRGPINAPTVLNSGLNIAQFWDGRARTLEEQAGGPVTNPAEMGSDWDLVLDKLRADPDYQERFDAADYDGITPENIRSAIATYERTLVTVDSPFDEWLRGDDEAIDDQTKQGYALFKRYGCINCHQGRNVGGNMYQYFGVMGDYFGDRGHPTEVDDGRFAVTGDPRDKHKFRVPSLRNVALTAPYFHDGTAETLPDAIRTMGRYQLGRRLADADVVALHAFLESLTGELPSTSRYVR